MVISRTPLRVSFAGGGSDLPWFSQEHGGAVVSTTIDKYIYVVVTERFEDDLRISYTRTEIVDKLDEVQHELVREALRIAGLRRKIEIVTIADVPAGTGLGSSSAVTVGVLNALFAYQGILKSASELAADAARIEIEILGRPIGKQDHYASAHGGLQLLRFGPGDGVRRDPVVLPVREQYRLERNLLMFYTGRQRAASDVLGRVETAGRQTADVSDSLVRMRDAALELYERLGGGADVDVVGQFLHENWQLKRTLHPSVSASDIESAYDIARERGAIGGKVLGAGGGGFLLFYVPRERQAQVRRGLANLRELPFRFETEGSRILYIGR